MPKEPFSNALLNFKLQVYYETNTVHTFSNIGLFLELSSTKSHLVAISQRLTFVFERLQSYQITDLLVESSPAMGGDILICSKVLREAMVFDAPKLHIQYKELVADILYTSHVSK